MDKYMFKFEFMSCYSRATNMKYHVIAETEEDLKTFLIQHNFVDNPMDSVSIIPISEYDDGKESRFLLRKFFFKSNYSDETYTVMTCDDFVDFALETTCNTLTDSLLLGEAIIRRDIEIFKVIGDLIISLPHTNIMDFALADIESTDNNIINSTIDTAAHLKTYRNNLDFGDDDAQYYIHESMDYTRCDGYPQPITLESYTAAFTERMVDVFE